MSNHKLSDQALRFLTILKLDAQRVFDRIKYRAPEYLLEFSLKRSREQFSAVFKNKYDETSVKELMLCGPEVIVALDSYYSLVDEMRWYLHVTQDMPNKVEDRVHAFIKELEKTLQTLNLYLNSELGLLKD